MKLLLHICCGPCAAGTIPRLRDGAGDILGFFYNPNIHPLLEYRRRLTGVREVGEIMDVQVLEDRTYDPRAWFATVGAAEGARCSRCIGQRFDRAAREAATQKCDAFSTTLSVSPWQDHDAIQTEGARVAALHGIEFVYQDLRSGYEESRRLSREWGIYRQKYCGCLLSEWERYCGS